MRGLPNDFRKSRQREKRTDLSFPGAAKRGIGLAKTRAEQRPTCIPSRRGGEESRLRSERLGPESVPPPERAASRVSFTSRKLRLSAPPKRKIPQRADGAKKRRAAADPAAGGKLSSAAAQAMPPTGQRNVTNQKDRSVAARRAGDRVGNLVRLLDAVLPVKGIRHIQRTVRQLSGFRHSADRFRSGRLGNSRTGDRRRPVLLGITTLLAYGSTLLAGFFAYFVCLWCYPPILGSEASLGSLETAGVSRLVPYFTVEMPPIADVTSALLLSFVLGLGTARGSGNTLKKGLSEFRDVIGRIIERAIVPLLPLYIFGIFLKNGGRGPGGRHSVAFSENQFPRSFLRCICCCCFSNRRSGGHRLAPQPAETASHDAARLHDGAGDAIFGGDHSRHAGADDPQRRESRAGLDSSSRSTRRSTSRAAS